MIFVRSMFAIKHRAYTELHVHGQIEMTGHSSEGVIRKVCECHSIFWDAFGRMYPKIFIPSQTKVFACNNLEANHLEPILGDNRPGTGRFLCPTRRTCESGRAKPNHSAGAWSLSRSRFVSKC